MAKKSTYQLKQLLPEEKPETCTKYIVRKPTKGLKVAEKLRQKNMILFLRSMFGLLKKKCLLIVNNLTILVLSHITLYIG